MTTRRKIYSCARCLRYRLLSQLQYVDHGTRLFCKDVAVCTGPTKMKTRALCLSCRGIGEHYDSCRSKAPATADAAAAIKRLKRRLKRTFARLAAADDEINAVLRDIDLWAANETKRVA